MTREERLNWLKQIEKDIYVCSLESSFADDMKSCAIHSVIEELEKEPCEDAVSREEITSKIEEWASGFEDGGYFDGDAVADAIRVCIGIADELPPVTPTHKKGKWVVEDSGNYNGKYSTCYCSNCKDYYTRAWREMKYCPNCGAEMESEE